MKSVTNLLLLVSIFGLVNARLEPADLGAAERRARNLGHLHSRVVRHFLVVTATEYNSVRWETSSTPSYGAWGDHLKPGTKAIAVSRDLLRLGLTHGVEVRIAGLPGTYRVLDKMARRWHRRIDIYMGLNIKAARDWGKRRVQISWDTRDP